MARKKKLSIKKRKNRGGERLNEWRVIKECSVVQSASKRLRLDENGQETSDTTQDYESPRSCEYDELVIDAMELDATPMSDNSSIIDGRRIVDIHYFICQIKEFSDHAHHFGCTLRNLKIVSEIKRGLRSGFIFLCNMCNFKTIVWSEPIEHSGVMDINTAAVAGAITTGGGFAALERILGALNVRNMSSKTFAKHQEIVSKGWEDTALNEMKEAAKEEISLAKERGDVSGDGTPLLTVVADGSWAKRSYRRNFNSLSGMVSLNYPTFFLF